MTDFELRTSGIGSIRSTNWATTTALTSELLNANKNMSDHRMGNEASRYSILK